MEQNENQFIYESFQRIVNDSKDKRIAIYGTGGYTVYILAHIQKGIVQGLMDPIKEGSVFMGYPVYTLEEAKEIFDLIVIISRESVIPIIYNRIAHLEESGIEIVDMLGRRISLQSLNQQIATNPYWNKHLDDLKDQIDQYEYVSFDIFDTLLMRKIMRPTDLFAVIEKKVRCCLGIEVDFERLRTTAERQMNERLISATYDEIYLRFFELSGLPYSDVQKIKQLEFDTEMDFICPRETMVKALQYACDHCKGVCLISDMYYTRVYLEQLLKKCGIGGYDNLIISSEERAGKWPSGRLFEIAVERLNIMPTQLLHIGDNPGADIQMAQKIGIHTYHIWSSYEMIVQSKFQGILSKVQTTEDFVAIGIILAHILNDPFALSNDKGTLTLKSVYDVAFAAIACEMLFFDIWILQKYVGTDREKLLFLARDGFLPQKIYEILVDSYQITNAPKSLYVLASRRAISVAGMKTPEDVQKNASLLDMKKSAKLNEIMTLRFGVELNCEEGERIVTKEELLKVLPNYIQRILAQAKLEREEYQKYLYELGISRNEKCVLIDAGIIQGTIQYWFKNMADMDVQGACLVLVNTGEWTLVTEQETDAFLGMDYFNICHEHSTGANYLLECFFTSDDGQFVKLENGKPVFREKEGYQKKNENFENATAGIIRFVKEYIKLCPYDLTWHRISNQLADELVGSVSENIWHLSEDLRNQLYISDAFGTGIVNSGGKFVAIKA